MAKFGEEEWVTAISHLEVRAAWDGLENPTDRATAIYQIPAGWVGIELDTKIHDKSGDYEQSVSMIGPEADLIVEEHLKEIYEAAIDGAASAGDEELAAKLKDQFSQHYESYVRYRSSKGTIYAEVSATPHGSFVDRMRSWIEISVRVRLRYIASPDPVALVEELNATLSLPSSVLGPLRSKAQTLSSEVPSDEPTTKETEGTTGRAKAEAKVTAELTDDKGGSKHRK
jgi:hypothetical protein